MKKFFKELKKQSKPFDQWAKENSIILGGLCEGQRRKKAKRTERRSASRSSCACKTHHDGDKKPD